MAPPAATRADASLGLNRCARMLRSGSWVSQPDLLARTSGERSLSASPSLWKRPLTRPSLMLLIAVWPSPRKRGTVRSASMRLGGGLLLVFLEAAGLDDLEDVAVGGAYLEGVGVGLRQDGAAARLD